MKTIDKMTLKEKLGQLIVAGFDGYTYNDHVQKIVEEYKVANIILFVRNIKDLDQLSQLNATLHEKIMASTGTMPLITIDQEGGLVTRIMNGATFCPGNMTIAATQGDNAKVIGEIMGEELARLGINMNLAPTLDVNNNPNNPVIGVRSYGDDPKRVAELGTSFIQGLQSKGIIATAKHFPGHGDVEVDSHYGLPIVAHDKVRLDEVELYPFKKAIALGVDAIMSAHIFFKAYEKEQLPATVSRHVMTGLLRETLGFKGLIVSDCMEMKAIDDLYTTPVGVRMGIAAGLDMVFVSHSLEKQIEALRLLEEAVLSGEIALSEIDAKVSRILYYKEKVYPLIKEKFIDNSLRLMYFDDYKNKDIAQAIVDESLTLVKGERFLPWGKMLLVATKPFAATIAEDKLDERNIIDVAKRELPHIDTLLMPVNAIDNDILEKVKAYDQVIVCSFNAKGNKYQAQMINQINQLAKKVFVITVRNPYDYLVIGDVANIATLYEYTPNAIRTIMKYVKGEIGLKGKLPIQLQRKFAVSASIYVGLDTYSLEDNINYLQVLHHLGINRIFISAHMPEANANFSDELSAVLAFAQGMQMQIILDVSKKTYLAMEDIKDIYSLRLDWGFSVDDIVNLVNQDFFIELNASIIKQSELLYLKDRGVDFSRLRISHNFYPKPLTGLDQHDVLKKNKWFKSLGLRVMAYLPSLAGRRPPIYAGLPTVEEHRNLDIVATLSDLSYLLVDEVCFGDAICTTEELQAALDFNRDELMIPIEVYIGLSDVEKEILAKSHINRIDVNPNFVRSSIREKRHIQPFNTVNREKFAITIDNTKFLRYQGEVGIMKRDASIDERVNVVGHALISEFLLAQIKPHQRFRFIIRGEVEWKK